MLSKVRKSSKISLKDKEKNHSRRVYQQPQKKQLKYLQFENKLRMGIYMKKCIIIPDSFKGTLSSIEICNIIKEEVLKFFPACEVHGIPIADGGEGTVDSLLYALSGEKVNLKVKNPFGEIIDAYYGKIEHKAIIEVAQAVGLPQIEDRKNPAVTTTYGVGQMMKHAIENGCSDIIIGLGGSCTNDGGVGAATALGTIFKNRAGEEFIPTGGNLNDISVIDNTVTRELLRECRITAMCDVDNPMYGQSGAAFVYAPQKGADKEMVKILDENLRQLCKRMEEDLEIDVSSMPGSGAAGGLGGGIVAFFGGQLKSGIETILDLVGFDHIIENADMIFTGEGRFDKQSLHGKAVMGIAKRAKLKNIPVTAIAGSIEGGVEEAYRSGLGAIFSINQKAEDFSASRYHSKENLKATVDSILRFYQL